MANQQFLKKRHIGPGSDCENMVRPDIGLMVQEKSVPGGIANVSEKQSWEDMAEVSFKTEYETDVEGKMVKFSEGDKLVVSRWKAETWQKRGVASIDTEGNGNDNL